jgi:hypothetical protein
MKYQHQTSGNKAYGVWHSPINTIDVKCLLPLQSLDLTRLSMYGFCENEKHAID